MDSLVFDIVVEISKNLPLLKDLCSLFNCKKEWRKLRVGVVKDLCKDVKWWARAYNQITKKSPTDVYNVVVPLLHIYTKDPKKSMLLCKDCRIWFDNKSMFGCMKNLYIKSENKDGISEKDKNMIQFLLKWNLYCSECLPKTKTEKTKTEANPQILKRKQYMCADCCIFFGVIFDEQQNQKCSSCPEINFRKKQMSVKNTNM
jgi:hypothetical protein